MKGDYGGHPKGAIVTGGSRGIGLAIARVLAEAGLAITICGRGLDALDEAVAELEDLGVPAQGVAADLTDPAAPAQVVDRHRAAYGRLDVLVNNAGVGGAAPIAETTDRSLGLQLDLNLGATVRFYREALPLLSDAAADGQGALVINTASISAMRPQAYLSVYSATKAGLVAFTVAMNKELGPSGIRSTALCPGLVDTDMTAWVRDRVAADEMLRADDIAGAVAWLLTTSPTCVVPEIPFTRAGDVE